MQANWYTYERQVHFSIIPKSHLFLIRFEYGKLRHSRCVTKQISNKFSLNLFVYFRNFQHTSIRTISFKFYILHLKQACVCFLWHRGFAVVYLHKPKLDFHVIQLFVNNKNSSDYMSCTSFLIKLKIYNF